MLRLDALRTGKTLLRLVGAFILVFFLATCFPSTADCAMIWYNPTFLKSDKEALDVLNSMRGSFLGSHLYPKQTLEIDKYGLRLFSEYIGTERKYASFWSWDIITVPVLKSQKSGITFANISGIDIGIYHVESLGQNYDKWGVVVYPADPETDNVFVVADQAAAVRFAAAVSTLAAAAGAKFNVYGGFIGPQSEDWYREKLNWKKKTGAVVKEVLQGGPFQTAGIQENDIILTFNGREVRSGDDLANCQQDLRTADTYEVKVPVTVFRSGAILNKEITYFNNNVKAKEVQRLIGKEAAAPQPAPAPQKPKFGASVRSLTEEDVKAFKLPSTAGVLVTEVQNGGVAQQMKVQTNDIIVEVNGTALRDLNHLQEILAAASVNKLKVRRGEAVVELVATVDL